MKLCPFCAEEIQDQAIKCKHCGEFLEEPRQQTSSATPPPLAEKAAPQLPWYFRKAFLVIMFLSIGPLALPLLWWHPQTSLKMKALVTAIVLVLTYALYRFTIFAFQLLAENWEAYQGLGI